MKNRTPRKAVMAPMESVGLDLGADQAVAAWIRRDGEVEGLETIPMKPAAMRAAFEGLAAMTIVLEAGNQSAWVARLLEEFGHVVLTCNARRLKLIAESTLKTDELDAQTLGRLARLAQLDPEFVRPVTVRSRSTQLLRSELKGRDQLVGMRTKEINFVRSVLRADALELPRCDADHFATKLDLEALPEDVAAVIKPHVEMIGVLTKQIAAAGARLRRAAAEMPGVRQMTEIDGVGDLTAIAFAACIEDPGRFERSRDVGPYLGLTPRVRKSGDTEIRGGITKQGDVGVRRLLVQAALVMMRSKRDSALKRWALGRADRRGKKKAVVALARKLAVVMHHLWVTGESYEAFPQGAPRDQAA